MIVLCLKSSIDIQSSTAHCSYLSRSFPSAMVALVFISIIAIAADLGSFGHFANQESLENIESDAWYNALECFSNALSQVDKIVVYILLVEYVQHQKQ